MMIKRVKQILKKFPWQEVILISTILIIGLPSLFVSWMIVDDGYYFSVEQSLSQAASSFNFGVFGSALLEPDRFRPALRLYLWFTYLIAGNNPVIHHLINFSISAITVILIYLIIRVVTSSKSAGLIGGLIFTLTYFNLENWYRLMTPEPKITFFVAISTLSIVVYLKRLQQYGKSEKQYLVLAMIPLFFAYFIREISFSLVPFSLVFLTSFLYFKKDREQRSQWIKAVGIFFVFNLALGMISLVVNLLLKNQGSYTGFYELTPIKMYAIGDNYLRLIRETFTPFPQLLGITFLISWISIIRSKKIPFERFWQFAFLISSISSFIVLLPWGIPVGRYLELVIFFLSLVMGIEVYNLLKFKIVQGKWYFLIFSLCFLLMVLTNVPPMFNYIRDTIIGQKNINRVLSFLAETTPDNSKIYWNLKENEGTIELVMEANLILDHIYNRPLIKIEYLNSDNIDKLPAKTVLMTAVVYEPEQYYNEQDLLANKKLVLLKTIPHEVLKIKYNSPRIRSVIKSFLTNKPILSRPLFEKSLFTTTWKIYQTN
jgi:hypothetical protein